MKKEDQLILTRTRYFGTELATAVSTQFKDSEHGRLRIFPWVCSCRQQLTSKEIEDITSQLQSIVPKLYMDRNDNGVVVGIQ